MTDISLSQSTLPALCWPRWHPASSLRPQVLSAEVRCHKQASHQHNRQQLWVTREDCLQTKVQDKSVCWFLKLEVLSSVLISPCSLMFWSHTEGLLRASRQPLASLSPLNIWTLMTRHRKRGTEHRESAEAEGGEGVLYAAVRCLNGRTHSLARSNGWSLWTHSTR